MADEGAADCEEGFVDVGASVIATLEATVLVQPGDRALDHPAFFAEPRPVGGIAFGDSGRDAPCAERLAVLAAVICPVGEQRLWPELAVNAGWRDPIHERDELGYVVAVTGGESRSQRGSLTVADHVVLGARPAAIDGRGACLFAPPFARTCELSTTALDQSNAPASCSSSRSTWCKRSQTPASFQSRKRRQHVIPDPQPISCGRSSHGMPVLRTNRMPVRACRSGTRLRPGYRYRRSTRGNKGSIRAHNPSLTKGFAMDTVYDNSIPKPLFVRRPKDFLRLNRPSEHIEWAYYYLYHGPNTAAIAAKSHAFDSALLPGEGVTEEDHRPAENPRQAYCVLVLGLEGCPAKAVTKTEVTATTTASAGTVVLDVYPEGLPTKYLVEYGTTTAYGSTTTAADITDDEGAQDETVSLSGLEPCTTYHYQAEAENEANDGTPGVGGDQTFTTGGCDAVSVATGSEHSCAVLSNGEVDCWGEDEFGDFGNGTSEMLSLAPVRVSGITTATSISSVLSSSCVVLSSGGVDCWGENRDGRLGDGSETASSIPVSVSGIDDATSVSIGDGHACAIVMGGHIECWGENVRGELGNGIKLPRVIGEEFFNLTPVEVDGITDATAVAVGSTHTCALLSGGSVDCWGNNASGQMGIGDHEEGVNEEYSTPQKVTSVADAIAITASGNYTCAVLSGGSIDCWGENGYGALGYETVAGRSFLPLPVYGITDATAVVAGENHTCALLSGGDIDCWGANGSGQLGNGTTESSTVPVSVSTIAGAIEIGQPTASDTCARFSEGGIDCWGEGGSGQLGNDSYRGSLVPVAANAFG